MSDTDTASLSAVALFKRAHSYTDWIFFHMRTLPSMWDRDVSGRHGGRTPFGEVAAITSQETTLRADEHNES